MRENPDPDGKAGGMKLNRELEPGERTDKCRTMRHICERDGCFEKIYRCQLGKLDHLFPDNNGMTDIDGYCLIDGRKIFLEWKSSNAGIPPKQLVALRALSWDSLVIVAWGDPKEMLADSFFIIQNGKIGERINGPNASREFDKVIKQWAIN